MQGMYWRAMMTWAVQALESLQTDCRAMPVVFEADGTSLKGAATLGAQGAPLITASFTPIRRPCMQNNLRKTCTAGQWHLT